MGGWLSLLGNICDFQDRLNRFKKAFSIEIAPEPRLEVYDGTHEFITVCWAWNKSHIPDVYVKERNGVTLALCGVPTDLGHFGPVPPEQNDATRKILDLWLYHDEKVVGQINGSFSCLFHDQRRNQVVLFTDRFASRSVWIGEDGDTYIIGNIPSAIAMMMRKKPKIDPVGLWSLFHLGRHLGTHGLYSNISGLLAGQKALISTGKPPIINNWWQCRYEPERDKSPSEWGYLLGKALLRSADRYRMVNECPHLFLSGGLDSRIAAAAFKEPLKTVTLCTRPNLESRIAFLVSKALGLEHETVVRSPYWYVESLEAAALISSGNFLNQHAHFIVPAKNICIDNPRAGFLLGDLLENFNKHYFSKPDTCGLRYDPEVIEDALRRYVPYNIRNRDRLGIHFNIELRRSIRTRFLEALRKYAKSVSEVSENHADRFDTFLRWADVSMTPTYSMIVCLWPLAQERNIFFDNELHNLSLRIPAELRGAGILHNWILHSLCKTLILIPDANTLLPPFLPSGMKRFARAVRPILGKVRRGLIQRGNEGPVLKTSGSWLLSHEMYRKDKIYRETIENLFKDTVLFPTEIFDLEQVRNTWKKYLTGNIDLQQEIEALISFGSLHQIVQTDGIQI